MSEIGYARVSRSDQDPALQERALTTAGCLRIFTDHGVSGAKAERPELSACLDFLREGDTFTVWKLDRAGRSLPHLIGLVNGLAARGIQFRSLTEGFDTRTPGGALLFHVLGSLAEFERALLIERTNAGLEAARAAGRKGGRPPALTVRQATRAETLYRQENRPVSEIAVVLGVSRATVYRALERKAS